MNNLNFELLKQVLELLSPVLNLVNLLSIGKSKKKKKKKKKKA